MSETQAIRTDEKNRWFDGTFHRSRTVAKYQTVRRDEFLTRSGFVIKGLVY